MPNHIHAIVRIENVETHGVRLHDKKNTTKPKNVETHGVRLHDEKNTTKQKNEETHGVHFHDKKNTTKQKNVEKHGVRFHDKKNTTKQKNGIAYRSAKSISSFVAGFKSAATSRINKLRKTTEQTVWQERFHDHIIRDNSEYEFIFNYITNNPANWEKDKFYTK